MIPKGSSGLFEVIEWFSPIFVEIAQIYTELKLIKLYFTGYQLKLETKKKRSFSIFYLVPFLYAYKSIESFLIA